MGGVFVIPLSHANQNSITPCHRNTYSADALHPRQPQAVVAGQPAGKSFYTAQLVINWHCYPLFVFLIAQVNHILAK